jgi:hypothetical protein
MVKEDVQAQISLVFIVSSLSEHLENSWKLKTHKQTEAGLFSHQHHAYLFVVNPAIQKQ